MNSLENFFSVFLRGQTYLNALYLLLAFPLGLFYFVFLVVGLSTGIPLIIVWIGLLILLGVFAGWYGLAAFERWQAMTLLHVKIPPMTHQDLSGKNVWQKFTASLGNPVTWKGLVYLLVKFPLGMLDFIVMVTVLSICAALILMPFYFNVWVSPTIDLTLNGLPWNPIWIIDTMGEALTASIIGIMLLLPAMHLWNGLAWLNGKFAHLMLGNFAAVPSAPTAAAAALPE